MENKKITKVTKITDKRIQEYVNNIERAFKIKIRYGYDIDNTLLSVLFRKFGEDFYIPTTEQIELNKKRDELKIKLEDSLTEEQKIIFNKYDEVVNNVNVDIEEQLFMFGYITANELNKI